MNLRAENIRNNLIDLLASGEFYSGEELGEQFGISRTAIAKHIKALTALGLDIYSVSGKGYRLASKLQLLNEAQIQQYAKRKLSIQILPVIDSTNAYLKANKSGLQQGHCILAEAQTAGKGRQGKPWHSPFGASLYMSCFWSFDQGYQAINGLSLVVGVAIANTLKKMHINQIKLKWPNDVYLQGRKLAGVLVEVEGKMGEACDCIIGVGLNIALQSNLAEQQIDQPWIDLQHATQGDINRNQLAALLVSEVLEALTTFEQLGLKPFIQQWQLLDLLYDKNIRLLAGNKVTDGIGKGINKHGGLLLERDGQLQAYYGGEISVRTV